MFSCSGVLLALAAAGGGWLAFGSAQRLEAPRAQRPARPTAAASLPPLPDDAPEGRPAECGRRRRRGGAGRPTRAYRGRAPKPTRAASAGLHRARPGRRRRHDSATALSNGVALPPLEAPEEVKQIIEAGNIIARTPYMWGGGHGKWLDTGYDCSGSVSFALAAAGLLDGPLASGPLMGWGEPGRASG